MVSLAIFIISVHPKKPTITSSPPSGITTVGEKFELTCQTESQGPQTNYTFYKGNTPIVNNGPENSTLTISSAQKIDNGEYSCQVEIEGVKSNISSTQLIRIIGKNVLFILKIVNIY